MSIVQRLSDPGAWDEYIDYKVNSGHISENNLAKLRRFVAERRYEGPCEKVVLAAAFNPPTKKMINKIEKGKKRIVYIFQEDEGYVLKLMTYLLLRKYDYVFAPNLYSFREKTGVKYAIDYFTSHKRTEGKWGYKVDISNYFNSVDVELLIDKLQSLMQDEPQLLEFLKVLLRDPYVTFEGEIIKEEKGIMAGCPIASFLANVYLCDLDKQFYKSGMLYGRYSDDIILFADSEKELSLGIDMIKSALAERKLYINNKKEEYYEPGDRWTFLGISYENGVIDVSRISKEKIKQKMRRKARALLRWKDRKSADNLRAAKAFVRVFNQKIYENPNSTELTWARWYFPLINTTDSLEEIDHYMQDCIRYIATGKRNKSRFKFTYEMMKAMGYKSMVHEYYKMKEEDE